MSLMILSVRYTTMHTVLGFCMLCIVAGIGGRRNVSFKKIEKKKRKWVIPMSFFLLYLARNQ